LWLAAALGFITPVRRGEFPPAVFAGHAFRFCHCSHPFDMHECIVAKACDCGAWSRAIDMPSRNLRVVCDRGNNVNFKNCFAFEQNYVAPTGLHS
jgi:hypothetical protein